MDIKKLQQIIDYEFKNEKLLIQALTHTSYANEQRLGHGGSNERLEFLGDAVLELVSSEFFYNNYPQVPEGELTKMRASFVCEPALAFCAESIPLGGYLLLGKGEDATGGRQRPSVVSDALESIIGAIYLDGGFNCASEFVMRFILNDIEGKRLFYDSKTNLQEQAQRVGKGDVQYIILKEEGPDHNKIYTAGVLLNNETYGQGTGSSKKHAEQVAAYEALKKIEKEQVKHVSEKH